MDTCWVLYLHFRHIHVALGRLAMIWGVAIVSLTTFLSPLLRHRTERLKCWRGFPIFQLNCVTFRGVFFGFVVLRHFNRDMGLVTVSLTTLRSPDGFLAIRCFQCRLASLYLSFIPVVTHTLPISFLSLLCPLFQFFFLSSLPSPSCTLFFSGMAPSQFADEGAGGDKACSCDRPHDSCDARPFSVVIYFERYSTRVEGQRSSETRLAGDVRENCDFCTVCMRDATAGAWIMRWRDWGGRSSAV